MKTLTNIQNGNTVTQRNAFLVIAVVIVIALAALNHFGVIDLSILNKG